MVESAKTPPPGAIRFGALIGKRGMLRIACARARMTWRP
jgi:hypothetical protein